MRKLPVVSGVFVAGALVVAACSGSPTASTLPTVPAVVVPSIAIPSIAIPSIAIPSFALPSLPTGSFAIPSFAFPSFNTNADPELAAKFPTQVGGQPVTDIETVNFVEFYQAFAAGDTESQAQLQAFVQLLTTNGINPTTLSFGSGRATVNDDDVEIQAFRVPGGSGATFLSLYPQLQAISQSDSTPPTQGTANVGGKNVTTFTDADGNVTYIYPSGDVVWSVDTSDQSEAAAVFQALQ